MRAGQVLRMGKCHGRDFRDLIYVMAKVGKVTAWECCR